MTRNCLPVSPIAMGVGSLHRFFDFDGVMLMRMMSLMDDIDFWNNDAVVLAMIEV